MQNELKTCPKCGKQLKYDAKFCPGCGTSQTAPQVAEVPKKIFCPKCGKELNAEAKFCGGCGNAINVKTKIDEEAIENFYIPEETAAKISAFEEENIELVEDSDLMPNVMDELEEVDDIEEDSVPESVRIREKAVMNSLPEKREEVEITYEMPDALESKGINVSNFSEGMGNPFLLNGKNPFETIINPTLQPLKKRRKAVFRDNLYEGKSEENIQNQKVVEEEKIRIEQEAEEERKRQEEAERLRLEREAEEKHKRQEEAERLRLEQTAEAERKRQAEAERLRLEREAEEERKRQEEAERLRLEKEAEEERKRQEEAERLRLEKEAEEECKRQEEAERLRLEKEAEAERKRQEEVERIRLEQEAEAERLRLEQEAERLRKEQAEQKARPISIPGPDYNQVKEDTTTKKDTPVICPHCGKKLRPSAKFCGGCGATIEPLKQDRPVAVVCPKCGKELRPGAKFCGGCGAQLSFVTSSVLNRGSGGKGFRNENTEKLSNSKRTGFGGKL